MPTAKGQNITVIHSQMKFHYSLAIVLREKINIFFLIIDTTAAFFLLSREVKFQLVTTKF